MNQIDGDTNTFLTTDVGRSGFQTSSGSLSKVAVEQEKSLAGLIDPSTACSCVARSSFLQETKTIKFASKMEANDMPTGTVDSPTSPIALKQDTMSVTLATAEAFDNMVENWVFIATCRPRIAGLLVFGGQQL